MSNSYLSGNLNDLESKLFPHLIDIQETETLYGDQGLYTTAARAAAALTLAKHGIIAITSEGDTLNVAGVTGAPIRDPGIISNHKGIIGKAFQERCFQCCKNVNLIEGYICFDEAVQSELAVPVFDSNTNEITAIINVEDENPDHFSEAEAWQLHYLGQFMLIRRNQIIEANKKEAVINTIKNEKEQIKKLIDAFPDEVMIIDKNFKPVYANEIKRKNIKRIDNYFKDKSCDLDNIFKLTPEKNNEIALDDMCHYVIEKNEHKCDKCICQTAMNSNRPLSGIIYRPKEIENILYVELSAAPICDKNDVQVGCIEIARNTTKRQMVIENLHQLFNSLSNDILFENIAELVVDKLHFERIRIYSVDEKDNKINGLLYNEHGANYPLAYFREPRGYKKDLSRLLDKGTTLRIYISNKFPRGYATENYLEYRVSRSMMEKIIRNFDPGNKLNSHNIQEIIITPVVLNNSKWLIIVDSNYPDHQFNSDELQALSIISSMATASLKRIQENQLRFKLAVIGETSMGFEHIFARHARGSEYLDNYILNKFRNFLKLHSEYLNEIKDGTENSYLVHELNEIFKILEQKEIILPKKGDLMPKLGKLEEIKKNSTYSKEIEEIARIAYQDITAIRLIQELVEKKYSKTGNVLGSIRALVELVIGLQRLNASAYEIKLYAEAFNELVPLRNAEKDNKQNYDLYKLLFTVVKLHQAVKELNHENVNIIFDMLPGTSYIANVNVGSLFLAFQALIKNACDAASEERIHSPEVNISLTPLKVQTVNSIKISIKNNGRAIPDEYIDKIKQHRPIESKKKDGSGLGLYFVHNWVSDNGGNINFIQLNGFTIFEVVLPLC